jgi:hypothetical protein
MIVVKCFYEDGDTAITKINCSFEEAKSYFVGKVFNTGSVSDNMVKCVGIDDITISESLTIGQVFTAKGKLNNTYLYRYDGEI